MDLTARIESFSELGRILRESLEGKETGYNSGLEKLINDQQFKNPWFTPENVRMSVTAIAEELTFENLKDWTSRYPALNDIRKPINIAVIMAGNIPLVGFHDFISVLMSGNNLTAKTSSKDPELIVFIGSILCRINPDFSSRIKFTDGIINDFNCVIATGSNNTSRYFEFFFGKYPHIIRHNRNSIAVIEGSESERELYDLGKDVFSYFGMGCRNVSKVYIPDNYDLSNIIRNWTYFSSIVNHNKYRNNYDYSKAIYLVNSEPFTDTGYLLLKESKDISSPVAVLYYEYYSSEEELNYIKGILSEKIQCISGRNYVPFGMSQSPRLWDYADGIDTLEFLLKKEIRGIL